MADVEEVANESTNEDNEKPKVDSLGRAYSTGKRKDAVARVWIKKGNGKITVNGINILETDNTDDTIHFTVNPNSYDSVAYRSNLLDINSSLIKVTGATDTIASGDTSAGVGYTSSSSYS